MGEIRSVYQDSAEHIQEAPEIVDLIFKHPELITIYSPTSNTKLRSQLMNSIMMHASDILGKLYLTLSWRNFELANSVTRRNLEDIRPSKALFSFLLGIKFTQNNECAQFTSFMVTYFLLYRC